jgi:hypothetical protein
MVFIEHRSQVLRASTVVARELDTRVTHRRDGFQSSREVFSAVVADGVELKTDAIVKTTLRHCKVDGA